MKAKQKRHAIPSSAFEQVQALIGDLSDEEMASIIETIRAEADQRLDKFAEAQRPKSVGAIPASTFRQISWTAKAGGNVFEAFLLATQS